MRLRIQELREDNDIIQQTIANYLNIKQSTYSQYENGQRQIPLEALIKLAEYYNIDIAEVYAMTPEEVETIKV